MKQQQLRHYTVTNYFDLRPHIQCRRVIYSHVGHSSIGLEISQSLRRYRDDSEPREYADHVQTGEPKKSFWALRKRNWTMDCPFGPLGWAPEPPSVSIT